MKNVRQPIKAIYNFLNFLLISAGLICLVAVLLVVVLILIVIGAFAYDYFSFPYAVRNFIPEKIEISKVIVNNAQPVFSPGGSCGSVGYKLSDKTAAAIETQGLAFFDDVKMTTTFYKENYVQQKWGEWHKQEYNPASRGERYKDSYGCTNKIYKYLTKENITLTDKYYTVEHGKSSDHATIDIYPREKILVFRYEDY